MNEEELKRLIEKYYSGESTEEEETALREYFMNNTVPEGYEAEKQIFSYYAESEDIPEPSPDFESRIMAAIDASEERIRSGKLKKYLLPILSAAAGLIIMAGSYFYFIDKAKQQDTFTDPEIAYTETIRILRNVSAQMNRGAHGLEPVSKINEITTKSFSSINKSKTIVKKNMKNLDHLQRAIDITHVSVIKNTNEKNQ
jgi:hypothetical protein